MDATSENKLVFDVSSEDRTPTLTVELITGELHISGWDRQQIEVTSPDLDEDMDIIDLIAARVNGNDVTLNIHHGGGGNRKKNQPRDHWDFDAMIRQASQAALGVSTSLNIRVPHNCNVDARTASGEISVTDVNGKVSASSASGEIRLAGVQGSALVKSASGEISLDNFSGRLGVRTMSGDISVNAGELDELSVGTASGDLNVTGRLTASGNHDLQSVSGDISLNLPLDTSGVAEINTVSGDISCGLPNDSQRSGKRRQKLLLNGGGDVRINIQTVSGDVQLEEWNDAPVARRRQAVTEPLNTAAAEGFRVEGGSDYNHGDTVRMPQQVTEQPRKSEMDILKSIEAGEISVEEGLRQLNELSQKL